MTQKVAAVKVELAQDAMGGWWRAYVWGKGAPVLRPVPGNVRPASAAQWSTEADARAELPALFGCAVEIVKVTPAL